MRFTITGWIVLTTAASLYQPVFAQSPFGHNLVRNPGAEEGGAATGSPALVRPIPGWDLPAGFGLFNVELYGSPGGFPTASSPGPPNRGSRFFAGGPKPQFSLAVQEIGLPQETDAIVDAGVVTYQLSGWLGGFLDQPDQADIQLIFFPSMSSAKVGPVTEIDRKGVTGLLYVVKTGTVPKGTRRLQVVLNMTGSTGAYNDAYADEISLVLTANPLIAPSGVTNAATYETKGVAPGEIVDVFGLTLAPATPAAGTVTRGKFDTSAGGVRVLFDGAAAPVTYASSGQLIAIVPYGVAQKTTTQVMVDNNSLLSAPVTVNVVGSAPGLFAADASGKGQGAILNENGSPNSAASPAAAGSIIVFYATGEGQTFPAGTDGALALGPVYPKPVLPVEVTIGGQGAEVLYYGAAPGLVAGAMQVNARVPVGTPPGNAPIVLRVGPNFSPTSVTVAVR